jgi:sulfate permease, SulP family
VRERSASTSGLRSAIPALRWLPAWRSGLGRNVVAALAVWAVLVPQSMAYASLAGVPAVNGLYAAIAGLLVYAVLGTSGQLNVGPSSGVAVLAAATVAPLALGDSDRYLALSAGLALLKGVILLCAGLIRLGFVAEFLAKPVLAGYVVGLGLVIAVGQVPALLGLSIEADGFFAQVKEIVFHLAEAHVWTVVIGVGTLVFLLVLQAVAPRAPGAMIAVVFGVLAARTLDLAAEDVRLIGTITASLPDLGAPDIRIDDIERLLGGALGVALLAYAESIAAARRFAAKHGYEVDANRELVAVGASNVAAGLAQGFPVDASMSRTAVADGAGQRTQLAGLLNVVFILLTIALFMGFFADLPKATLSAIVIGAVLPLMRTGELRRLQRLDDVDFAFAAICLVGVLLLGVLEGIVFAVLASLVALVYRSFRPNTAVLGLLRAAEAGDEDFHFRDLSRHPALETFPGLVIFRFDQEIFFANAALFRNAVRRAIHASPTVVKEVLVDAGAITHVDTSGLDMLTELHAELARRGIRLHLARIKGPLRDPFERAGVLELLGPDAIHPSVRSGVNAFLRLDPGAPIPGTVEDEVTPEQRPPLD